MRLTLRLAAWMSIIIIINCVAGALFRVQTLGGQSSVEVGWVLMWVEKQCTPIQSFFRKFRLSSHDGFHKRSTQAGFSSSQFFSSRSPRAATLMHIQVFIKVNRSGRCAWGRRTGRAYLKAVFLIRSAHSTCSRTAQSLRISRLKRDRRIAIGTWN